MLNSFFIPFMFQFFLPQNDSPQFESQVIDNTISIGYGLAIGDVDGDTKPDILLADKKQFVWYRNGDWKRFVLAENLTEFDNVCIAARDIDGDGKVEVAVGAQWNPGETSDTLKSGAVYYLVRPKDPTKLWTTIKLHAEPTVHRMKWVKVEDNRYQLIVVPLHGRGNKNGEGNGVKVIAYEMPKHPAQKWKYYVVDQSMHMTHNFDVIQAETTGESIHIGGKEGIKSFRFDGSNNGNKWLQYDQRFQIKDKSFGEVRIISGDMRVILAGRNGVFAGITPMHGNELAIHDNITKVVLTDDLNQGHALASSDLLGTGRDQIIVGWREPNKENKVGIKIFVSDISGVVTWKGYWIDDNGMACEDLQVADLDGDGKKDIIAAGRASHNLKIYWNKNSK